MLPFQLLPTCLPRCPSQPLLLPCIPLFPACSVFTVHIPCQRVFSIFSLLITFCIPSFLFFSLFPGTLTLLRLFQQKNKHTIIVGSESLGKVYVKLVRNCSSSSLGSNICLWHWCMGSNYPGDARSEIYPLFPQVML